MIAKPIPESYWVVPGKFLAGAYPVSSTEAQMAHRDLAAFLEAGFTHFFDLTNPGELPPYLPELEQESARFGLPIHYQRNHIQDKGLPTREGMVRLLDDLDATLASGQKVYLHCWGGIGRTGTTVGCWLVRHGLPANQALVRLNEIYRTSGQSHYFPRSPETDAQMKFILGWNEPAGPA